MFKNTIKYFIIFSILVVGSVSAANSLSEAEVYDEKNAETLIFWQVQGQELQDKHLRIPAVLRYFISPDGSPVQMLHKNQVNSMKNTKLWLQDDQRKKKNTKKKG